MAIDGFQRALALTLSFEGGYCYHPLDPGGPTNRGITRATLAQWRGRPVSKAEVMALSLDETASIYRQSYWNAVAGDRLPPGLDLALFDHAVNAGPARAVDVLRAALGLPRGRLDDEVLRLSDAADRPALIRAVCRRRLTLMQRLASFRAFGRGWTRRVAAVEAAALTLA